MFERKQIQINWLVYEDNKPVTGLTELVIEGKLRKVIKLEPGEYKPID